MRRLPWIAALAALAACSLPQRDNPYDPAIAPEVLFTISPLEGSRTTVFHIDATATRGGNGRKIYRYNLDGVPGFDAENDTGILDTTLPLLPGADGLDPSGVGTHVRQIEVQVTAGPGLGSNTSDVSLRNERPVLEPGNDIVTTAYRQHDVVLDACGLSGQCESFDPDGDPLVWTWTQVGGAPVTLELAGADGRRVRFSAPLTPQMLYFEIAASDGIATERVRQSVRVGSAAWIGTTSPTRTYRVHPEQQTIAMPVTSFSQGDFAVEPVSGDVAFSAFGNTGRDVYRIDPFGNVLAWWNVPEPLYFEKLVVAGDLVCAAWHDPDPPYQGRMRRLLPAVIGTAGTTSEVLEIPANAYIHTVAADPADPGACIALTDGDAWSVTESGAELLFSMPDVDSFTFESVVTRDRAVWTLSGATSGFSHVTRIDETGFAEWDVPVDGNLDKVLPIGGSSVLLFTRALDGAARELFVIDETQDVRELEIPAIPLAGATFSTVPEDSTLYIFSVFEQTLRRFRVRTTRLELTSVAGLEDLTDTSGALSVPAPDPWNGGVIVAVGDVGGGGLLVRAASSLRSLAQVPSPTDGTIPRLAVDPVWGTAWSIGFNLHDRTVRIDGDGNLLSKLAPENFYVADLRVLDDGNVMVAGNSGVSDTGEILRADAHGAVVESVSFPQGHFVLAYDVTPDGAVGCATTQLASGAGSFFRIEGGVFDEVDTSSFQSLEVAVSADGTCWFSDSSSGVRLIRADAASTQSFTPGMAVMEELRVDPRDGSVWGWDSSVQQIRHVNNGGVNDVSFPGGKLLDVQLVLDDGAPDARVWHLSGDLASIVMANASGNVILSTPAPEGDVTAFDVQ